MGLNYNPHDNSGKNLQLSKISGGLSKNGKRVIFVVFRGTNPKEGSGQKNLLNAMLTAQMPIIQEGGKERRKSG